MRILLAWTVFILANPVFGQLGSGTLPIWEVVHGATSYQMLLEGTTASAWLNQANQQGQSGYRYRHGWGYPSYAIYVRDNTASRTYSYQLLSEQTTASAYLSQMNQQGSAGYLYLYPFFIDGVFYASYVKDDSAGRTFTYTYYESTAENSSDALSQMNQFGSQGYAWLVPLGLGGSYTIYTFCVKDTTSGQTYSYRKVSGGTSLSALNQQGQDGYLYLTPLAFSDGTYDIYIKDNSASRTYSYRVLSSSTSAATKNQQGSEEYEYLIPLGIGDVFVKVGASWQDGQQDLGGGWKRLYWFGDYADLGSNWIWHSQHGYEYVYSLSTPTSIYFWDFSGLGWLWTSSTLYPYLYRFSDGAWLWYQIGSSGPRWFNNLTTGHWESH